MLCDTQLRKPFLHSLSFFSRGNQLRFLSSSLSPLGFPLSMPLLFFLASFQNLYLPCATSLMSETDRLISISVCTANTLAT